MRIGGKRRQHDDLKKKIVEFEKESTIPHSFKNWLWKRIGYVARQTVQ